ncbi:MAG TPA: hypothetical protein VEX87_01875 [Skermanella sp.]|jgi:hypothetical protein|nr:hypothetical protein [Skermanella sp.]
MFGHSITPELGRGPAAGFVPLAACSPAPLPQWRMAEVNAPAKQPPRDYGADVRIPQADRVTRALLDAIF